MDNVESLKALAVEYTQRLELSERFKMASSRKKPRQAKDEVRAELHEILKNLRNKSKDPVTNDLLEIKIAARGLIAEKLPIDDEYELYTEPENLGAGINTKSHYRLRPKVERDRDILDEVLAITTMLDNYNVDLFQAIEIFEAIEQQILQSAVKFTVHENGEYHQVSSMNDTANQNIRTYHPKDTKYGVLNFLICMNEWFRRKIDSSLPDDLPERRIAIKRLTARIEQFSETRTSKSAKDCLAEFLKETDRAISDQIEINEDRNKLGVGTNRTPAERINSKEEAVDIVIGKTGLKHKRHPNQTFNRTALFFHYLFGHIKLARTNIGRAEVLHFLTAYSVDSFEQKIAGNNIYGEEGDEKFLADLKVVIELCEKIKLPAVIKQIINDHPEIESFVKP